MAVKFFWAGEKSEIYVAQSIEQLKEQDWWKYQSAQDPENWEWGEMDPNETLTETIDGEPGETRTLMEWCELHTGSRDPQSPSQIWTQYT